MSDDPKWTAIDGYLSGLFVPPDPALDAALEASRAAGLPAINVSPSEGKLLHLLARSHGARKILEIGTLGGYSTIWVARGNIANAGLADRVEIRVGRAIDLLPQLESERAGPFDFIFIDADKPSNP